MVIAFFIGVVVGFGVGFLCYRNNAKKLADAEEKLRQLGK